MVTIRTRLSLCAVLPLALGMYYLLSQIVSNLDPRYREATEENLVETATLLAASLSIQSDGPTLDLQRLSQLVGEARSRTLSAVIYGVRKESVDLRIEVTDQRGVVLYSSQDANNVGRDHSQWNDVYRTLRGEYGARTTRDDKLNPLTTVLYVASPIVQNGKIAGVLSVGKPLSKINVFIAQAKERLWLGTGVTLAVVAVFAALLTLWVSHPIRRLTEYARGVTSGRRLPLPQLGKNEMGELGAAFEEMRVTLEGKRYIERYLETLTHELKSPLTAIRGAAELIDDSMSGEIRGRFLANILAEVTRLERTVSDLLELSVIENRRELSAPALINISELTAAVVESRHTGLEQKDLSVRLNTPTPAIVLGDEALLRQAIAHVLENAIDFSPNGGEIAINITSAAGHVSLTISNNGPLIPDYALPRLFERFFSTPRPESGRRSTGLGLALTREILQLHNGTIAVGNRPTGGVSATIVLPREPQRACAPDS